MTDETAIAWGASAIRVRNDKDRLWVTFNQTVFAVDPVTSRALAAALTVHADAIDPPDSNEEDDRGKMVAWLVEPGNGGTSQVYVIAYYEVGGARKRARAHADRTRGIVTALHRGDVIHDATRPKQCESLAGGQRCHRNAGGHNVHVALFDAGPDQVYEWATEGPPGTPSITQVANAAIAAVRDRDEREGQ